MNDMKLKPDFLFEISWEVCNKVGGINTVIATKARTVCGKYGDRYFTIGPDLGQGADREFEEDPALLKGWRQTLYEKGIRVRVGHWRIVGRPQVILVDFSSLIPRKDDILKFLWESYRVDSISGQWDYIEPVLFGYAAGLVVASYVETFCKSANRVAAHFHEWMTAAGGLYLRRESPYVATLFTTHATVLGRSIAGNGMPLYRDLTTYNADDLARRFGVTAKHSIEKKAAANSDAFLTVSGITATECRYLLGHEVDVVTPNGFEDDFVPKGATFTGKRKRARAVMLRVANSLLGQEFDDDTLIVGTSGRYEFKNKGIDVFLESLNRLNRDKNLKKNVLAFINVPSWVGDPREDLQQRLKKKDEHYTTPLEVPFITHWLHNMTHDQVLDMLKYLGMNNRPEDKVKVIFVPCYQDGKDGILNKHYYDLILGEDLSVYPSYYEPWGYTPLEAIAFKVPCITTDLAGFGLWVNSVKGKYGEITDGVKVIHRNDYNYFDVAETIKETVEEFAGFTDAEVKAARNNASSLSKIALWSNFIKYYYSAYDYSLRAVQKRISGK